MHSFLPEDKPPGQKGMLSPQQLAHRVFGIGPDGLSAIAFPPAPQSLLDGSAFPSLLDFGWKAG
jgi:hypothetical protein